MKTAITIAAAALLLTAAGSVAPAQERNVKLQDVVVTATKTEKELKDVTQSVTVLSSEDIRRGGAANVADAIRSAAGILVNDQGPRGSLETLSIRGSHYSQVLVLLDGKRLNSPRDSGVDLSAIPVMLDEVERIEVVRGPASALYGADAVGGVVNIITKRPTATQSRIGLAAGSHGFDSLQAGIEGRKGPVTYAVNGARETSDGYRTNSDLEQWVLNGRLGFGNVRTSSLDLSADYISKENGVPGSRDFPSTLARQAERGLLLGAVFHTRLAAGLDLKVSGIRATDQLGYQDPDFAINSRHESTGKTGDAQLSWLAGTWSLFTVGYELRKDKLDSTDSGQHQTKIESWYGQDELSVGESLILVVGVRHDSNSVYGDHTSPKASARYLFTRAGTILRASYGESFRGPTFNDLYWTDAFSTGNPDLRPETAVEYEVGLEQPFGKGAFLKATGFKRRVNDLINWNFLVTPMTPENIGRATIRGVEGEAAMPLSFTLSLGANYSYTDPIDDRTGEKIYYTIPRQQGSIRLTLTPEANVYLTFSGRMVDNYVKAGDPEWHYVVADAKLGQKIGRSGDPRGEIYVVMTNVFDRKYDGQKAYPVPLNGYPAPPREIRGGITFVY